MKILSIEAACPPGSIAIATETDSIELVASAPIPHERRTTETFASIIAQLLKQADWAPSAVDRVVTTNGPGSFTGLRIGVTAAKVFAYATHATTFTLNTLELIARQVPDDYRGDIESVLYAQRGQVFAARFTKGEQLRLTTPTEILSIDRWIDERTLGALLTGPGLKRIEHSKLRQDTMLADEQLWMPSAETLALVPEAELQRTNTMDLVPSYFRKSAAEEKADAAAKSN